MMIREELYYTINYPVLCIVSNYLYLLPKYNIFSNYLYIRKGLHKFSMVRKKIHGLRHVI